MKRKLSIVCMMMFVAGFMAGSAFGAQYQAGSATMGLDVGQCATRTVSIDCADFGTSPLIGGGFYIDNSAGAIVSITDPVSVYEGTGLWDVGSSFLVPDPGEPPQVGNYFLATVNLGAGVTPAAGVLIADVEFCCAGAGGSTITVGLTPPEIGYALWVTQDLVDHDPEVSPFVITVTCTGEAECGNGVVEGIEECDDGNTVDGDCCNSTCTAEIGTSCDDGLYCNGADECNASGVCANVGPAIICDDEKSCTTGDYCDEGADSCVNTPNNASCSDGQYCNGAETCDPENINADPVTGCVAGTPVECPDNELYCDGTEYCDEDRNACASDGNPCPAEAPVCIEVSDECRVPACSITLEPPSVTLTIGQTQLFNVVVEGTCDNEPIYTWAFAADGCTGNTTESGIGSSIDDTGLYTAGDAGGQDVVRVNDVNNGDICALAEVTVIGPTSTTTTSVRPPTTTTTPATTTTTVEPTTTTTSIVSTTTTTSIGPTASIKVVPDSVRQSRWLPLLRLLRIEGTNTNFVRRESSVTFQPANAVCKGLPVVFDSDTILMRVFIMPMWLTGAIDSVEVTVITGSESVSVDLGIELLPFFLEEGNAANK